MCLFVEGGVVEVYAGCWALIDDGGGCGFIVGMSCVVKERLESKKAVLLIESVRAEMLF